MSLPIYHSLLLLLPINHSLYYLLSLSDLEHFKEVQRIAKEVAEFDDDDDDNNNDNENDDNAEEEQAEQLEALHPTLQKRKRED